MGIRRSTSRNGGCDSVEARGAELVNLDLAAESLQAECADESAVGTGRQVQRLSVQARCQVRGGTE